MSSTKSGLFIAKSSKLFTLAFYFQFIQNAFHLLESSDTCRYQRQTQAVFYHPHHIQHGFYTCRITIYEKQLE